MAARAFGRQALKGLPSLETKCAFRRCSRRLGRVSNDRCFSPPLGARRPVPPARCQSCNHLQVVGVPLRVPVPASRQVSRQGLFRCPTNPMFGLGKAAAEAAALHPASPSCCTLDAPFSPPRPLSLHPPLPSAPLFVITPASSLAFRLLCLSCTPVNSCRRAPLGHGRRSCDGATARRLQPRLPPALPCRLHRDSRSVLTAPTLVVTCPNLTSVP